MCTSITQEKDDIKKVIEELKESFPRIILKGALDSPVETVVTTENQLLFAIPEENVGGLLKAKLGLLAFFLYSFICIPCRASQFLFVFAIIHSTNT